MSSGPPVIPPFEAVIFDGDGVLFDSEHLSTIAFLRTMKYYGFDFQEEDAQPWIGISTRVMLESLHESHGFDVDFQEYIDRRDDLYEQCCREIDGPKKLPGVDEFLDWLEDREIPYAVASSASPRKLSFNLARTGLTRRFATALDNTAVERGKPAPDVFVEAALRLQVDPENCLIVEDSVNGLKAALAAEAIPVAIEGSHDTEILRTFTPHVFANPGALLQELRSVVPG